MPSVEVVVSTYEREDALRAVLSSLEAQTHRDFTVAVADDGSGASTAEVVRDCAARGVLQLRHVWHEDEGFRLAVIRNRAIASSRADYLVLLDGDCVVPRDFVANHTRLAEPGFFVRGTRMALRPEFSGSVLESRTPVHEWGFGRWAVAWARGRVARLMPALRIPLGPLRKWGSRSLRGAAGANLGLWRADVVAVNGFDEAFAGYGYEDWELLDRLLRRGVRKKNGRFAVPFYHLWHPERPESDENRRRWEAYRTRGVTWAESGMDRYSGDGS